MRQQYVLVSMNFVALAVTISMKISFSLILTQMVFIPNVNESDSITTSSNELICPNPINYTQAHAIEIRNEIGSAVCILVLATKH